MLMTNPRMKKQCMYKAHHVFKAAEYTSMCHPESECVLHITANSSIMSFHFVKWNLQYFKYRTVLNAINCDCRKYDLWLMNRSFPAHCTILYVWNLQFTARCRATRHTRHFSRSSWLLRTGHYAPCWYSQQLIIQYKNLACCQKFHCKQFSKILNTFIVWSISARLFYYNIYDFCDWWSTEPTQIMQPVRLSTP